MFCVNRSVVLNASGIAQKSGVFLIMHSPLKALEQQGHLLVFDEHARHLRLRKKKKDEYDTTAQNFYLDVLRSLEHGTVCSNPSIFHALKNIGTKPRRLSVRHGAI